MSKQFQHAEPGRDITRGDRDITSETKEEIKSIKLTIANLSQKHDELTKEANRKASKRQSIGSSTNPKWQRLDEEIFSIYNRQKYILEEIDQLRDIIKEISKDIPSPAEPMVLSVTYVDDYLSSVRLNEDYKTLKAGTVFRLPGQSYFMRTHDIGLLDDFATEYTVHLCLHENFVVLVTWTAKEGADNFQVLPWGDANAGSTFKNVIRSSEVYNWLDGFSLGLEQVLKQEKPEWFRQ